MHFLPHSQPKQAGFTLIEMLVSLSLFTIVVTIAVGSFLSLIGASGQLQGEQSVMSTLTFAMDSMSREIRTGTRYYCFTGTPTNAYGISTQDCVANQVGTHGVSFIESGTSLTAGAGSSRISFYFDNGTKRIMRRVGTETPQSIISSGISITRAHFFVSGSTALGSGTDVNQPAVTIIIEATETGAASDKPFILETTVTQRELDL